jgi:hypothetical protein
MSLYESSRVYTSIARIIIEHNFVFMIDSFIKQTEFKSSLYKRVYIKPQSNKWYEVT